MITKISRYVAKFCKTYLQITTLSDVAQCSQVQDT